MKNLKLNPNWFDSPKEFVEGQFAFDLFTRPAVLLISGPPVSPSVSPVDGGGGAKKAEEGDCSGGTSTEEENRSSSEGEQSSSLNDSEAEKTVCSASKTDGEEDKAAAHSTETMKPKLPALTALAYSQNADASYEKTNLARLSELILLHQRRVVSDETA